MIPAKTPLPQLSMEDIDRLLVGCARPAAKDGSILELSPERAPRIWRPAIQHLIDKVGQRTPTGRNRVAKVEWEALASRFKASAAALLAEAEQQFLFEQEPSALDLDLAPLLEPWAPGKSTWPGYCVAGRVQRDPYWHSRGRYSSKLRNIDLSKGWARDEDRFYRLGQRLPAREIEGLNMDGPLFQFRECGDEELELILEAERAHLRWRLGQLKPPHA